LKTDTRDKIIATLRKGWCQHVNAMDADGVRRMYDDPRACKVCLNGAIAKITGPGEEYSKHFREVETYIMQKRGVGLTRFNDEASNVEQVISLLMEIPCADDVACEALDR
jgi:hypothetical protein